MLQTAMMFFLLKSGSFCVLKAYTNDMCNERLVFVKRLATAGDGSWRGRPSWCRYRSRDFGRISGAPFFDDGSGDLTRIDLFN